MCHSGPHATLPLLEFTTGGPMLIRLGYELIYEFAQATPMILNLNVHYSRSQDLVRADTIFTDPLVPLVISVGRYWPASGEIRLADLWVPTGHALYIPPKPLLLGAPCMDLHNNRNSARACWGNIHKSGIATHTLLQTSGTYTYWYWNPLDTDHSPLR